MSEPLITVPAELFEKMVSVLERLEAKLSAQATPAPDMGAGFFSYEDLRKRFAVSGEALSRRQVERIVQRHAKLLPKHRFGNRKVGFAPADVDRVLFKISGRSPTPTRVL